MRIASQRCPQAKAAQFDGRAAGCETDASGHWASFIVVDSEQNRVGLSEPVQLRGHRRGPLDEKHFDLPVHRRNCKTVGRKVTIHDLDRGGKEEHGRKKRGTRRLRHGQMPARRVPRLDVRCDVRRRLHRQIPDDLSTARRHLEHRMVALAQFDERVAALNAVGVDIGKKRSGRGIGERRDGSGSADDRIGVGAEQSRRKAGHEHDERPDQRDRHASADLTVFTLSRAADVGEDREARERERAGILPGVEARPFRHDQLSQNGRDARNCGHEGDHARTHFLASTGSTASRI